MKNSMLFVICWLACVGINAQQENFAPKTEYSNVTIEVNDQEENNISRVDNIKYSIDEYESMIQRCKELTIKLVEYEKMILEGSMTKKQKKQWKRDVVEAKMLNFRIDDFTTILIQQNYSLIDHVNKKALSDYYDFSKVLESSINFAGL
ncbi:hypothetical protein U6A24_14455 [Aquimarina gracilis]|uniref:Uncharacterized protein n=1 Tax=Aquimarina gracilis TaxID=874422 RepID=A0ABU5ZXS7_9FLAO|nr:hypothetical protein [Aquimarina gracilis]MEB3346677.1 hypothetical protein [Aquimarina gracilis]